MLPLDFDATLEHIVRRAKLMILSDRGIDLIALFEGFSPVLYNDPAGNATIGFGFLVHLGPYHPSRGVCAACDSYRAGLTEDQGKTLLREKAQTYADCMERSTAIRLNANEHAALASFTYNLGCAGYVNSSVRPAVNARGDVCSALKQYIYGTDRIAYAGLLRRRAAECELFNTPVAASEEDGLSQAQYDELKAACDQNKTDIQGTFGLALRTAGLTSEIGRAVGQHIQEDGARHTPGTLDAGDAALAARLADIETRLANIGKILA